MGGAGGVAGVVDGGHNYHKVGRQGGDGGKGGAMMATVYEGRELQEELGITLPKDAFELIFFFIQECVINDGTFINNEYNDVYLVTIIDPIPLDAFTLQESEVSAVKYIPYHEYRSLLAKEDPNYVPYDVNSVYGQLFKIIEKRYKENVESRSLALQKQLSRYAHVSLSAEITGLNDADKKALALIIKAAKIMDRSFYLQVLIMLLIAFICQFNDLNKSGALLVLRSNSKQVWYSNPSLRDWLREHAGKSQLDELKWSYYQINKSPWSCLDENEAFLTTADSAVKLLPEATKPVTGWKGLQYRTAFPVIKPPGANFYPPDMDKMEYSLWRDGLPEDQKKEAMGFFNVIRRHSESELDIPISKNTSTPNSSHDLYIVPYCQEYNSLLAEAAGLLHEAGDLTSSLSLRRFLHSKADAFLSNDYYDSDIAWMELCMYSDHIV
nr:Nudix hydrolase 3 [Ipomoea batatas]